MVADKEKVAPTKRNKGEEEQEQVRNIDFKMVTFTLAGKDYGIDIMNVKEISKATRFTYVPNTAPFVRGVHNLRGEIISIIDLRLLFNLPIEEKEGKDKGLENILILRIEEHLIGVVVDSIDKVVGVDSSTIQPPHPLFGDINIKFIHGVVDNDNKLYIILDVDRIFSDDDEEELQAEAQEVLDTPAVTEKKSALDQLASQAFEKENAQESAEASVQAPAEKPVEDEVDLKFIEESLANFKKFFVTSVNSEWVHNRYKQWVKERGKDNSQLQNAEDADKFLAGFNSSDTGRLWSEGTYKKIASLLPKKESGGMTVWNPGCGKGYEAYSILHMIKSKNPDVRLKVFSNDNDLLGISNAPTLNFKPEEVPEMYKKEMSEGKSGLQFNNKLKEQILFEYHDVTHTNPYANLDLVVARDIISYLKPENQVKFFKDIYDKMKPEAVLVLGDNERLPDLEGWQALEADGCSGYKKA